jgi:hypothetical protein
MGSFDAKKRCRKSHAWAPLRMLKLFNLDFKVGFFTTVISTCSAASGENLRFSR